MNEMSGYLAGKWRAAASMASHQMPSSVQYRTAANATQKWSKLRWKGIRKLAGEIENSVQGEQQAGRRQHLYQAALLEVINGRCRQTNLLALNAANRSGAGGEQEPGVLLVVV